MIKKINSFKLKNLNGFSLIEVMVVVVILGLIVLGLVTFFTGGARSWIAGQRQLEAQRNARQAIDRMVREIREGNSIASSSNTTSITINYPALFGKSAVTYSFSGNIINRNAIPLINNVKTLNFSYPEAPIDSSKVHILLEVDVDNDNNPDITLNTDVNLRNHGLGA